MKSPLFSIVIPVFNRAHLIARTLDSVAAQTFHDFELIVVDNASTDTTLDVVRDWGKAHPDVDLVVLNEPQRGAAKARNCGLSAARGAWTLFFDSDDTMDARLLELILPLTDRADIVGWNVRIHRLDGSVIVQKSRAKRALFHTIFNGNLSTQRYAARTDLIRSVGGWNGSLRGWDDIELGVHLLLAKPEFRILGVALVDIYAQEESITGRRHADDPAKWESALDSISSLLHDAHNARAERWVNLRRAILAGQYTAEGNKAEGERLIGEVLSKVNGRRWLYRFAYHHTAHGRRGAARLPWK